MTRAHIPKPVVMGSTKAVLALATIAVPTSNGSDSDTTFATATTSGGDVDHEHDLHSDRHHGKDPPASV